MENINISIHQLSFFSSLVKDYLRNDSKTESLFSFPPTIEGLKKSLLSKKQNYTHRISLKTILDHNYTSFSDLYSEELNNISLLKSDGYVISTAHQPCLFGGPLYTISKAISVIALAKKFNEELGENKIVPIYVIGSEDHDKEELLHTYLFHKKYEWQTPQTGSIGSMSIDDSFELILNEWLSAFGNMPHSEDLQSLFKNAYARGNTITTATKIILRKLFSHHGLIILDLNLPEVKEAMIPVFERELSENISFNILQSNFNFLSTHYTVQAPPRIINLFEYTNNGERQRIDKVDDSMIERLKNHPEKFSPNVILRPLMQQAVLPSICNVGGGAEVAYWLQLKPLFDKFNIDFPVILLRDIFSPIDNKSWEKWTNLGLNESDFFLPIDELKKKIVLQNSSIESEFNSIQNETLSSFQLLEPKILAIDKSLKGSYEAEYIKLQKSLEMIYAKLIKAEKKKQEDVLMSIENIKNKVFESNTLIERKENFSTYYLRYGQEWIDKMIADSNALDSNWKLIIV